MISLTCRERRSLWRSESFDALFLQIELIRWISMMFAAVVFTLRYYYSLKKKDEAFNDD